MDTPQILTGDRKSVWIKPAIRRIDAGAAENGINPSRSDGTLSMGS